MPRLDPCAARDARACAPLRHETHGGSRQYPGRKPCAMSSCRAYLPITSGFVTARDGLSWAQSPPWARPWLPAAHSWNTQLTQLTECGKDDGEDAVVVHQATIGILRRDFGARILTLEFTSKPAHVCACVLSFEKQKGMPDTLREHWPGSPRQVVTLLLAALVCCSAGSDCPLAAPDSGQ